MLPKGTSNDERGQVAGQVGFQVSENEFQVGQVTGQVGQVTGYASNEIGQVAGQVKHLLQHISGEMSLREMMARLRLSGKDNFKLSYLTPAINQGLIEMTQPNSPKSPTQKYRLTEKGKAVQRILESVRHIDDK